MRGKVEKEMLKAALVAVTLVVDELTAVIDESDVDRRMIYLILQIGLAASQALKKVEDDQGEPPS